MKGKKILAILLALVITLPVTAYAQGNGKSQDSHGNKPQTIQTDKAQGQTNVKGKDAKENEHKQQAMENKDAKKQQIEAFKTQMTAKHTEMKALSQQISAAKREVQQKREQLSSAITGIVSGEKTLSDDLLKQLLTTIQNLGKDTQGVQATAQISGDVSGTQTEVNNGQFNNALTSMDKVIAKLQARLDALKQLSADLDKILAIVNAAGAPSSGDQTTTTTTGSGDQTTVTTPSSGDQTTTTTTTTDQTSSGSTDQTTTTTGQTSTDATQPTVVTPLP